MIESELEPKFSDGKVHALNSYALSVLKSADFVQDICSPCNLCTILTFPSAFSLTLSPSFLHPHSLGKI